MFCEAVNMYFQFFWFRTLLTWIFRTGSAKVPQQRLYSWYRYCTAGPAVNCHSTAWSLLSFVVVVDVCFLSRMSWHCRFPGWNFESLVESTGSDVTYITGTRIALSQIQNITFYNSGRTTMRIGVRVHFNFQMMLNAVIVAGCQFVLWKRVCRGTILVATGGISKLA